MMTNKEYLIAVTLGFFAVFGWLLHFIIVGGLLITGEIVSIITYFNIGNVIYVFVMNTIIFILSLIFMIYLFKYAGAEKEIKEAKKRGEYGRKTE